MDFANNGNGAGLAGEVARFILTDYVSNPAFRVGSKLPPMRNLAEQYKVAILTVGKAISILAAEGWVRKLQGSGIYIAKKPATVADFQKKQNQNYQNIKIGWLVPNLDSVVVQNITKGVVETVHKFGYKLEIAISQYSIEIEKKQIESLIKSGIDGIVINPGFVNVPKIENHYLGSTFRDFPIVVVDLYHPSMMRPHVVMDNKHACKDIVEYLIRQGCKKIAFLKFSDDIFSPSVEERIKGYHLALEENQLTYECIAKFDPFVHEPDKPGSLNITLRNLFEDNAPDGIIVINDVFVLDVIHFLDEKELTDSVMIGSFDNIYQIHTAKKWISTNPNFKYMGQRAVEMLIEKIKSGDVNSISSVVLHCPVVFPHTPSPLWQIQEVEKKLKAAIGVKNRLGKQLAL